MAETAIEEPVDAEVVDERTPPPAAAPGRALERVEATLTVAPQVAAEELGKRLAVIKQAMENEMKAGVDYGVIPGTNSKPTLLKPGAEKLSVLFQLDVQLVNEKTWGPGEHLTVVSRATVFHATTGARLGGGEGICSTREKKYAYRRSELTCPECGAAAVLKSKKDDEPGFFCWRKKDGCGYKFTADDPRITSQDVGRTDNPDLPDEWNTVIKMAQKRARIDAILAATGASALFTQDVEEKAQAPQEPAADPARPHGPQVDASQRTRVSNAAKTLCGGSVEGGKALYVTVAKACEGYMPYAAGLALVEASKVLVGVPWDPEYQPGRDGDLPSASQAAQERRTTQPTGDEIAKKGIIAKEAWMGAGLTEPQADQKVAECDGKWNALVISEQAAEREIVKHGGTR